MDPLSSEPLVLAALSGLSGVAVIVFDRDLRFERVFGGALDAHGYVPERMLDRRAPDVLPAEVWARVGPLYLRALSGETFEHEVQSYDGVGEYIVTFSPVEVDGAIEGGMMVAREMTGQRRAERRFRELAESATDLITISRADDDALVYCSPSFAQIGLSAERIVGTPGALHVHPDDAGVLADARALVVAGGDAQSVTVRLRDGDNEWQWIESDIRGVSRANGTVAEVHASGRIVTERRRMDARWGLVWQHTNRGCTLLDAVTDRIEDVNPAFVAMHGGTRGDWIGRPLQDLTEWPVAAGDDVSYEDDHLRRDGSRFPVSAQVRTARDVTGEALYRIGFVTDLTDQRAREAAEAEVRETFERAFADAPIGLSLVGLDGRWQRVNRALLDMFGYEEQELLGRTFSDLTHPDDLDADLAQVERLVSGDISQYAMEKRYFTADGRQLWTLLSVSLVRDEHGEPLFFVSQIIDISTRKRTEQRLRHLADRDPLTGLWNRRRFEEELARQSARSERYREHAALLAFDLDGFKYVNDTLGHKAGDDLLTHVARILAERLRDTDGLARLGGDEFAAVLPNVDLAAATAIGQELCDLVAATPLMVEGEAVELSLSAGVTLIDDRTAKQGEAMIAADVALFEAKHRGRGRAIAFDDDAGDPGRRLTNGLVWSRRLRRAIASDGFELHAQPIVDLETGEAAMYELLLRMPDDDGRLIGPADFLYTAERFGLIRPLDRWVVGAATRLAAAHPAAVLSVNLSGRSVTDASLGPFVEAAIASAGCRPDQLVFEVTETEAIAAMEPARDLARRLRRVGCRFALDDFGSGFASFFHLKALPLDLLKIDGEFVRALDHDRTDQLVVDAVQRVAAGMGKSVVAEHVEDAATAVRLSAMGVRYGQGYHFARPEPADAVLARGYTGA